MKIRILVAKPGPHVHDTGAGIMARAYRDAGFVVYFQKRIYLN